MAEIAFKVKDYMMKRIVFFINTLGSGGAEHQLIELSNGLVERGYDITICTFGDIEDHYKFNKIIKRHRIAPGKNRLVKILAIWIFFLTVKADWIVGFGQRESLYMLGGLFFRLRRKIHLIVGERNTTIRKLAKGKRLFLKILYKRADYIVPNSYTQRKHIVGLNPEYETKTITITNYTNIEEFSQKPLPNSDILRICVFGRYTPQKNCIRFVEVVKLLKTKTRKPFVIDWYGSQHLKYRVNPYYLAMKEKVEEYDLQNILVLKDQIKDVAGTLIQYDAFCLPSLWEGFSNAISEAICCGRPCLVSDVADNSIMVEDNINGFLFNPNDVDSMVNAFVKFFSISSSVRQEMGIASRERAEKLFNRDIFIGAYENLFNNQKQ